jgi:putative transposase
MSAAGIAGVRRRKFVTTTVKGSDRQAPDLVDRNFTAERPNLLWVADITYIPTWAGFLYLAVVLDAYSRIVVCSVGDAYDNAMCESFFATLECELLDRRRFKTQAEARIAVFEFIEGFYNPRRRHSSIGYLSPIDYERRHAANPDAHQPAAVLASVKDKPASRIEELMPWAWHPERPANRKAA